MRVPGRIGAALASFALLAALGLLVGGQHTSAAQGDNVIITVTLSGNGQGSLRTDDGLINCVRSGGITSGACTHTYFLTGPIPFGYTYKADSGSCRVVPGGCDSGQTVVQDMIGSTSPDQAITGTLQLLDPVTITVKKSGTGSGTVTSTPRGINCGTDCKSDYPRNGSLTLKASAKSGSKFVKWSAGPCSGQGSTCTFHATSSVTVTATFDKKTTATPVPVITAPPPSPTLAPTPVVTEGPTPVVPTPFPTIVDSTPAPAPLDTPPPKITPVADTEDRTALLFALGSLLVVVLAAGGLYAMRSRRSKAAPPDAPA